MVKAIIFDIGDVIVNLKPISEKVLKVFQPEDEEKFWGTVNTEAIPLCKGEISLLHFWRTLAERMGKDIPDHVLEDLWAKNCDILVSFNEGMHEIINSLKKTYKLAILSNTIDEHAKINEKLGIYELFDVIILSHEVGLTKSEKEIFLLVAETLGVIPEECVFIDDVKKFIDVAHSVGMKTILFENAQQLKSDLQAFNVLV